jgi:pimeloyl-ACP methyl ester carboxylesterase
MSNLNAAAMQEPRLHHVTCAHPGGLHRMAYAEWGDPANPEVVVCVHGLARQGRDFDTLARALAADRRVICPDVVGRGRSDWLTDPSLYQIPTYVADMVTLIARLGVERVDWVGTSMGGLIGMGLAGLRAAGQPPLIRRMVVNDVGPALEPVAIARIGQYLGQPLRFESVEQGIAYLQTISASFGPHTPEQWAELGRPMLHPAPEGGWRLHYDPAIAVPFRSWTPEIGRLGEALLWQSWASIEDPLLLRGAESDLLSAQTAQAMVQRGRQARCVEFAGVGHAPMLMQPDQVDCVRDFLLGG